MGGAAGKGSNGAMTGGPGGTVKHTSLKGQKLVAVGAKKVVRNVIDLGMNRKQKGANTAGLPTGLHTNLASGLATHGPITHAHVSGQQSIMTGS